VGEKASGLLLGLAANFARVGPSDKSPSLGEVGKETELRQRRGWTAGNRRADLAQGKAICSKKVPKRKCLSASHFPSGVGGQEKKPSIGEGSSIGGRFNSLKLNVQRRKGKKALKECPKLRRVQQKSKIRAKRKGGGWGD